MKRIILFFVSSLFIVLSCQTNPSSKITNGGISKIEKTAEELKAELKRKEQENALNYISAMATMRENFIGEKVIEGVIINTSTVTPFKDPILEIKFYSKTNTELNSQKKTIYELLNPNSQIGFKIKTIAPKETEKFSAKVIEVTPIE